MSVQVKDDDLVFPSFAKRSCTPSGISTSQLRSTFLFGFWLEIVKMWIAGVWNPFSEFPDLLQVLQEKVRQNVIWGYEKASQQRCFFDIRPKRNPAPSGAAFFYPRASRCPEGRPGEDPRTPSRRLRLRGLEPIVFQSSDNQAVKKALVPNPL